MPKPKDTHWIVATDGGGGECLRCGAKETPTLPMSINAWCAFTKRFIKKHTECELRNDNKLETLVQTLRDEATQNLRTVAKHEGLDSVAAAAYQATHDALNYAADAIEQTIKAQP